MWRDVLSLETELLYKSHSQKYNIYFCNNPLFSAFYKGGLSLVKPRQQINWPPPLTHTLLYLVDSDP